jgi:restriction endonuclease Mrr
LLIDGAALTRLMIEHRVGVQASGTGAKKVENGYFERLRDG